MNIKNILFIITVAGFAINSAHAIRRNSITIVYSEETKQYKLIESFLLDRKPNSCTRDLNENTLILIHDKNNNKTITSAKELAKTIKTPLKVYDVTLCTPRKSGLSQDFYVLQSGFIENEENNDELKHYCNGYADFIKEHIAQQEND